MKRSLQLIITIDICACAFGSCYQSVGYDGTDSDSETTTNTDSETGPDTSTFPDSEFITVWDTSSHDGVSGYGKVRLPLVENGEYDFLVSWGDGTQDIITSWDDAAITHTYSSIGIYEVRIQGLIKGWAFNSNGDERKFAEIKNWGPLGFGDTNGQFSGCRDLTIAATDIPDLEGTRSLRNLFRRCSNLTTVSAMNNWDVSGVTDMSWMLTFAMTLNPDIGSWDTSNVTTMKNMFYQADAFSQDISGWNIASVTDMDKMFYDIELSTSNYDAILIGFESQDVQDEVEFGGGDSKCSSDAAAQARQRLLDDHGWVIVDDGQE